MKHVLAILSILGLLACSHGPTRGDAIKDAQTVESPDKKEDPIVGRYKGGELLLSEVDQAAQAELEKLRLDLEKATAKLRLETAERVMIERILSARMAELKVDREQLLEQEVIAKIPDPSDEDVRAVYDENREQMPDVSFEVIAPRIRQHMKGQAVQSAIESYISRLKAENDVQVFIEPYRVAVDTSGPSKGPADAPVVIVEFADYECPYCSTASENVEIARQKYPDKVRVVFKDFPLGFHQNAIPAAVAARCAGAEGKYWEMHDKLFSRQQNLGAADLTGYAADLGLNAEAFAKCMADPSHAEKVQADMDAGQSYGVDGTPAFFVNGIMLGGAQPPEAFIELIEKELALKASKKKLPAGK